VGWRHDPKLVRSHWAEAKEFFEVAKGDQPAGLEDLIGRPFRQPDPPPPVQNCPVVPQPVQPVEVNIYLLQAQQMLEANIINQQTYQQIIQRVYGD